MGREEEIQLIAYSIWEQEDCCNGRDVEHWLRAEVIWEDRQKPAAPVSTTKESRQATIRRKANKAAGKKP